MTEIGGTVAKGYESVRDAFATAQAADPGGAQLCVYRHGERVVDLWTGRDIVNDRPYTEDTLTILMSCTKGATAVMAAMLAERRPSRCRSASRALLAGVRGERQGACDGGALPVAYHRSSHLPKQRPVSRAPTSRTGPSAPMRSPKRSRCGRPALTLRITR